VITEIRNGHAVDRIGHKITTAEASVITKVLAAEGIRIEPASDVFGVLHLWAKTPIGTAGEVRVLRAFKAVGDSPLEYHPAVK
jgi:hypothetical protein